MLDIFAKYATDTNAELNGTWRDIEGGARLLIARMNNNRYGKLLGKLFKVHQQVLESDTDQADEVSDKVMIEVVAKTILLGWSGLSYKGVPIEYSVENAEKLLAHAQFRQLVMSLANEVEAYRAKVEEEQGEA